MKKNKVILGMSGGVDSSVAAAALNRQGFEVIGVTFRFFDEKEVNKTGESKKASLDQHVNDAAEVCRSIGIEHRVITSADLFKNEIINYFIDEYMKGRTPNPCTRCNPLLKWGEMLRIADEENAYYVATGHYISNRLDESTGRWVISKGTDGSKDQSYVLWGMAQEQIARTLFPLSGLTKIQTRELADEFNLIVKDKPESQEVCFIPDNDYHRFMREAVSNIEELVGPGDILFGNQKIGEHKGFPFYTIGQRKGLGVTYKEPLYVKEIIPAENIVKIGRNQELSHIGVIAESPNIIKYSDLSEEREFTVKIRYNDPGHQGKCKIDDEGRLIVRFAESQRAITPGQSLVMYEGNDLVGGGIISGWF